MSDDQHNSAFNVWLSRGLAAQPSPRRSAGRAFDAVLGGYGTLAEFDEREAKRREATEARHRAVVAELCDAFGLSAEERASVTAYRGPGNPDALAFLVGGEVAAMVAGEPDETGNCPVTIACGWQKRFRPAAAARGGA